MRVAMTLPSLILTFPDLFGASLLQRLKAAGARGTGCGLAGPRGAWLRRELSTERLKAFSTCFSCPDLIGRFLPPDLVQPPGASSINNDQVATQQFPQGTVCTEWLPVKLPWCSNLHL